MVSHGQHGTSKGVVALRSRGLLLDRLGAPELLLSSTHVECEAYELGEDVWHRRQRQRPQLHIARQVARNGSDACMTGSEIK